MSDDWKTPGWLMDHFLEHFDPCPSDPVGDYLSIDWKSPAYVNPPYSRPKEWVKKAIEQQERGIDIVMLLRVDVSTEWYKMLVEAGAHFCYFNERLRFSESNGSPNFCSMLVFLEGKKENLQLLRRPAPSARACGGQDTPGNAPNAKGGG